MMNWLALVLLDLVQVGESPLYSAYHWLGEQLGREVSMPEFVHIVADMVDNDLLQLWLVEGTDRTELYEIPEDLGRRYAAIRHDDKRFDPFGLSLTIGPKADRDADPDWKVDLQFDSGEFVLEAKPGAAEEVLRQLARLFPDVRLVVVKTSSDDDRVRVAGRLIAAGDDG